MLRQVFAMTHKKKKEKRYDKVKNRQDRKFTNAMIYILLTANAMTGSG